MTEPVDIPPEAAEPPAPASQEGPAKAQVFPTPLVAEPTNDALFEALWAKVLGAWDDDKVHTAILDYSLGNERLPDLAGRYRALKDDPEKGARSTKRLDAIVIAATNMMMSMQSTADNKVPLPITLTVAGIFICAVAFVGYAMAHR